MVDAELPLSRGSWPAVLFERDVARGGRAMIARRRQREATEGPDADDFWLFLSLDDIQSSVNADTRGSGYVRPGAPELFDELVERGALRRITDVEFTAYALFRHTRDFRAKVRTRDDWFAVVPGPFTRLYGA